MTPADILARLKARYPNLDWTVQSYPTHLNYDGCARDEQVLFITHWGGTTGYHSNRVDVWVCGSPRPQFQRIESALEWLEWLQGVMAGA